MIRGLALGACAAVLGAIVLWGSSSASAAGCSHAARSPAKLKLKQARGAVLCLVNQRRRDRGLRALRPDPRLVRAAQRHSSAMDELNFFSHDGPDGSTPYSRIRDSGYFAGAATWSHGELLRWGRGRRATPGAVVRRWMASAVHRSRLLSPGFKQMGVGVAPGSPLGRGERNAAIYTADLGRRR